MLNNLTMLTYIRYSENALVKPGLN